MRMRFPQQRRSGFTMVEIALCIAIIGFALVAIIGVLPTAMRVQQDNRADTLIDQDGIYLMEAIRHGARGLDDLTNYVKQTPTSLRYVYREPPVTGSFVTNYIPDPKDYNTGGNLIGILSTPRTNDNEFRVEAEFRAISGSAVEKDAGSTVNFEYLLVSEVVPFSAFDAPTAFGPSNSSDTNAIPNMARDLHNNLYELRLTFRWPLFPSGGVGGNKKVFRALVSGTLPAEPIGGRNYFWFQPTTYLAQ